jgi:hypothetical protein
MKPQRQVRREFLEPIAEAGTEPKWHRKPQRQQRRPRRLKRVRIRMPKMVESGEPVRGYKGCALYKGTHVCRSGESDPGTITGLGPQQCEVKWARSGVTQAEITAYLQRFV